mmetsp:Transcript_12950/g.36732  ORF Transcript_12950/g.36732 Transcript_12950/m.36732 type:complete len:498 (-) Transcript_12950:524-2017(-)
MAAPDARFHRAHLPLAERLVDELLLRDPVRGRHGRGTPVLPALGRSPHRVPLILQETELERYPRAAVATHVAVGGLVERLAPPRDHVPHASLAEPPRQEDVVDPERDVELDLVDGAVLERVLRQVGRTQGGRAGGVRDVVRAPEVEDEAEPVRDDGLLVGASTAAHVACELLVPVVLVQPHGAAAVVRVPVGVLLCDAHLEEALRADLEHVPLQRVHDPRIAGGDLEVLVVEHLDAVAEGRVPLNGRRPRPRKHLVWVLDVVEVNVEAGDGDRGHAVATGIQPGQHRLGLVPLSCEAGLELHDGDAVSWGVLRPVRGRSEGAGLARPAVEDPLRRLGQQVHRHREHLVLGRARVLVELRAEKDDGVGRGLERDTIEYFGDCSGLGAALVAQRDRGAGRAQEGHGPEQPVPPGAEVVPQHLVVGQGAGVVLLVPRQQRQAHQGRRALVEDPAQDVHAVGLQELRDARDGAVGRVQGRVVELAGIVLVEPHDLPLRPGA